MKRKSNPQKMRKNMKKEEHQPTEKLRLGVGVGGLWRSQPLLEKEVCNMACTEGMALRKRWRMWVACWWEKEVGRMACLNPWQRRGLICIWYFSSYSFPY